MIRPPDDVHIVVVPNLTVATRESPKVISLVAVAEDGCAL